jgi:hypothetical protein
MIDVAGAEAVREPHEAELRVHPQDELLGEARQVQHDLRRGGSEFDREIAVGHRIDRVGAHALEAELARNLFAVDRIARAGQRRGAQRQAVDAATAVLEALHVTGEHCVVGEQMVAESDGLRDLQMREPGHDRVGVALGEVDQRAAQPG